ncbi:hypothetical protein DOY81_004856 [Sarcophaga bullata]|nr:hypothetical protein DOY81_004856 [Sarcophaga bullata]
MDSNESYKKKADSCPSMPGPESKKLKLETTALSAVDNHAKAMKVAGFSLSAIEEMRNRADEDSNSQSLDQQLRHFQVLDEVGSNSEDDDLKCMTNYN